MHSLAQSRCHLQTSKPSQVCACTGIFSPVTCHWGSALSEALLALLISQPIASRIGGSLIMTVVAAACVVSATIRFALGGIVHLPNQIQTVEQLLCGTVKLGWLPQLRTCCHPGQRKWIFLDVLLASNLKLIMRGDTRQSLGENQANSEL